jgi:hypothetical protein
VAFFPVRLGSPLALTEAAWIPGHHSQKFVESDITGVVFTANGQTISWQRDDVDLEGSRTDGVTPIVKVLRMES